MPRPEWHSVRELAAEWGVPRDWLRGVVFGMDLETSRGACNATMILERDRAKLQKKVQRQAVASH